MISYNKLPPKTKHAVDLLSYASPYDPDFGGDNDHPFCFVEDNGKFYEYLDWPKSIDVELDVSLILNILKEYELLTADIKVELFPFIFFYKE
jgi:hypothetical protein